MTSREELILDAAIAVLGQQGARLLTHRAVDTEAGLPQGSTSNLFRTREALIGGVIERFAARERAVWEMIVSLAPPADADQLAMALSTFVSRATGADRALTLARYGIFMEAAWRPRLQHHLAATAAGIQVWAGAWLRAVGSADPDGHCRMLMFQLDGIMLHQVAFPDPAFDAYAEVSRLVRVLIPDPVSDRPGPAESTAG
ncbi:DNA-binding transcriptional regulator YbjK [Allocatelliglobosispora scoriae]|uniref:DNA-binding transcriptional regulator YbjK n=1 Tax=Allocatelliglobosispora scoriae TaxID=643052 RepID=A0A841BNI3_9ACTN|nr:TetR/AcrR family transcriptional regulator [Allocatelliglobosispora scoriae]MBB5868948.1 DNA-binding transcriptional regulator YbjK [Allocatelliglobosispora scoriae]